MNNHLIPVAFILCAACFSGPRDCGAAPAPAADAFEEFVCDGSFFTAKIPKSWTKAEAITTGRQAREYGVDLKGPKSAEGAYARISLVYYGADHRQFKTMDKYILLNSRPDSTLPIKGEKYGPVTGVTAAGRKGRAFEVRTFDFVPPYAVNPKKVDVYEKKIVLPGKAGGFYVLTYHAPAGIAKDNLKVFEKVLTYFKPGK